MAAGAGRQKALELLMRIDENVTAAVARVRESLAATGIEASKTGDSFSRLASATMAFEQAGLNVRNIKNEIMALQSAGQDAGPAMQRLSQAMRVETSAARNLGAVRQEIEKLDPTAKKAGLSLGDLTGAIQGLLALRAIQGVMALGKEMLNLGMQASRVRTVFENLGGSAAGLEQLQISTRGMVDEMTAMQAANKFLLMGIAQTTEEAASLAGMATVLGTAMGQDATTAMADFAAMMANQSIPRLDNFGISSGRVRARIEELTAANKSLSREQAFTQAVLEQGATAMQRLGDQSGNAAGQVMSAGATVKDIKIAFGEMMAATLEASGALGTFLGVLIRVKEFAQGAREVQMASAGLRAELQQLGPAGIMFAQELGVLELALRRGRISADEFQAGVASIRTRAEDGASAMHLLSESTSISADEMRDIRAASQDASSGIQQFTAAAEQAAYTQSNIHWNREELELYGRSAGETAEVYKAHVEEMKAAAEQWAGDMATIYGDAMGGLQDIVSQHQATMVGLQGQFDQSQAQSELQYQMSSLQARANYEAESLRLAQAGKTAELNNLTAKFQASEANSTTAYAREQQMAQLNYLQQQMTQQRAYVKELEGQRRKGLLLIAEMALQYYNEGKLSEAGLKAILGTIQAGNDEILNEEIDKATKMQTVNATMGSNMVNDAVKTVEGLKAAWALDVEAAKAQAALLQMDFEKQRDLILASIGAEYTAEDFGFDANLGADLAKGAKGATEPATRALSDVVKQIDDGIKAALSAIKNLVDFDLPAGVETGLAKVGEFVKMAVTQVYGWLEEPAIVGGEQKVKDQLEKIKDSLEPLIQVLQLINVDLSKIKLVELPNLTAWAVQVKAVFDVTFGLADTIRTQYGMAEEGEESGLSKVAAIVGHITTMLGLAKIEADKMRPLAEMAWPDLAEWGRRLFLIVQAAVAALQRIQAEVPGLTKAVLAVEDTQKALAIIGVNADAMAKMVEIQFPDLDIWARRLFAIVQRAVEVLQRIQGEVPGLANAVKASDDTQKAMGFIGGNFESMNELVEMPMPDLKTWGDRLFAIVREAAAVLEKAYRELPGMGLAAQVVEQVKAVLSLIGTELDIAVPIAGDYWGDFKRWLAMAAEAAKQIKVALDGMDVEWASAELFAAKVADNVKKVLDLLGIDLDFASAGVFFRERLPSFLADMLWAAGAAKTQLETMDSSWEDAEMPALRIGENIKKILDVLGIGLHFELPTRVFAKLDLFLGLLKDAAEKAKTELGKMSADWQDAEMPAAQIGKNMAEVLDILGISLDFRLPNMFDLHNRFVKWMGWAKALAERIKTELDRLGDDWRDAEMPAVQAAENFKGVMDILSIEFTLHVPAGPVFMTHLDHFFETMRGVAPRLLNFLVEMKNQFTVVQNDIETNLLPEAADTAEQISSIFGIFDVVGNMFQAYQMPSRGGANFGKHVINVLGEALAEIVPGLKDLQTTYLADMLLVSEFVDVISAQIDTLVTFIQSVDELGRTQITRQNILGIFANVIGALQQAVQMLSGVQFTPLNDLMPVMEAAYGAGTGGIASAAGGQQDQSLMKFADSVGRFEEATTRYGETMNLFAQLVTVFDNSTNRFATAVLAMSGGDLEAELTSRGA